MHYPQALSNEAHRKLIFKRTLQGMTASIGAPLGWLVIELSLGIDLYADITTNILLYLYMLFGTMIAFGTFGFYVGHQESLMQEQSLRDMLTGLYNLRHFRDRLDAQINDARRQETPLSLIFFDLDHFKRVNDTYGHAAGDKVLVSISHTVSDALRRNELFARIGGEEFAILMPHATKEQAKLLAERLLDLTRKLATPIDADTELTVTMSLGVVELGPKDDAISFAAQADEAMYQAKEAGRNQAIVWDDIVPPIAAKQA